MSFLNSYYQKITQYDLINKFCYKDVNQFPKLEKIILNFGYKKSSFKHLISGLLALESISSKKSQFTKSKYSNLFLKIKKGNPVGCKVVLKKNVMFVFYLKLLIHIFPKFKQSQTHYLKKNLKSIKSISLTLKTPLLFPELENQYQFFKDLPSLNLTLLTNSKSFNEFIFLLKSIKFFI